MFSLKNSPFCGQRKAKEALRKTTLYVPPSDLTRRTEARSVIGTCFRRVSQRFRRPLGGFLALQSSSSLHPVQMAEHHPQIEQPEQRLQLRFVLGQPEIESA